MVLMSFFLSSFRRLGPRIDIYGSFMMLWVFLVLFWALLFGLLMFRKYSVAMLVSVFLLCPFSVKMSFKKSISLRRCFSVHILYAPERIFFVELCLSLVLSVHLLLTFSERFWNHKSYYQCCCSYIKEIELLVFIFEFSRALN